MKQTKDKPIEPALEESGNLVPADRSAPIEATLQPLNEALDNLRSEASAFTEASEHHATRIETVLREKSILEQRLADLKTYENDIESDAQELTMAISSAKSGLELNAKRQVQIDAETPADGVMQASWQTFQANFYELRARIRCFHEKAAQRKLDEIAYIQGDARIFFKSGELQRANGLTIGFPDSLNHVAIAEQAIADLRVALEEIDDLSGLGVYVDPVDTARLAAAEAIAREAADSARRSEYAKMLRECRFTPPPKPDAKSALIYPGDSGFDGFVMAAAMQEADERNAKQLAKWQKEGTAPRTAGPLGGQVVQK